MSLQLMALCGGGRDRYLFEGEEETMGLGWQILLESISDLTTSAILDCVEESGTSFSFAV